MMVEEEKKGDGDTQGEDGREHTSYRMLIRRELSALL